jgi:uncharacterized membrane protein
VIETRKDSWACYAAKKCVQKGRGNVDRTTRANGALLSGLLTTLFFLSGFSALLYQVIWQRMLGLFSVLMSTLPPLSFRHSCWAWGLAVW